MQSKITTTITITLTEKEAKHIKVLLQNTTTSETDEQQDIRFDCISALTISDSNGE